MRTGHEGHTGPMMPSDGIIDSPRPLPPANDAGGACIACFGHCAGVIARQRRVDAADAMAPRPRFHCLISNPSLRISSSKHVASDSCSEHAILTFYGYGGGRRLRPSRRRGVARRWPTVRRYAGQPHRPRSPNSDTGR